MLKKLLLLFFFLIFSYGYALNEGEYDSFIKQKSLNFIEKIEDNTLSESTYIEDIDRDFGSENTNELSEPLIKNSNLDLAYSLSDWIISPFKTEANTLFYNLFEMNLTDKLINIESVQQKLISGNNSISKSFMKKLRIEDNIININNDDFIYSYSKYSKMNSKSKIFQYLISSGYFIKKDKINEISIAELEDSQVEELIMQAFYYKKLDQLKTIKRSIKNKKSLLKFLEINQNFYTKIHSKKNKIKINQAIINLYLHKSEYIDLMIAKHNKNDHYLIYQIITKNKSLKLSTQDWFQLILLNLNHMMDLKINEKYHVAYNILLKINSNLLTLDQYHRQQWSLGYLATKLGEYDNAINHFKKYSDTAIFSSNKSRALYWISIVYEYMLDNNMSILYKKEAAKYPFSFYGQNAIEDLIYHKEFENEIFNNEEIFHSAKEYIKYKINKIKLVFTKEGNLEIPDDIFFLTGMILYEKGYTNNANDFFRYFLRSNADENIKIEGLAIIKKRTSELFYKSISIYASRLNILINDGSSFPVFSELNGNTLIHALVKQESGFSKNAISSKNARGLMQVIPETARMIARSLKIKYDKYRLVVDEAYNLTIGRKYLSSLLEMFNGNKVLALAAYNAGPGSVNRWLDRFGDLRKMDDVDMIVEWIESIPFTETKHYVMKIMENEMIYKALIE